MVNPSRAARRALAPLKALRLVVSAKLKAFNDAGQGLYNVRLLMGPLDHFAIEEARVRRQLDLAWAS